MAKKPKAVAGVVRVMAKNPRSAGTFLKKKGK